LAAASFSPSSFRNLEAMGGPVVTMWWTTSWLTGGKRFDTHSTAGNSLRSRLYCSLPPAALGGEGGAAGPALTGPALAGPALTGPALAGPALTGPAMTGPALAGPAVTAVAGL
jgi:hypothetical protein